MKAEDLLDYTLGGLEGPSREAAEADLARDPSLAARAERLRHALHLLLDDGDPFEPPAGLASRTIAAVAERKSRRAILDFVPVRVPFRWADVAVAAGILMAGLLTLVPAVKSARDKMNQAGCGFNLQQLYHGLVNYAAEHKHYPKVCGQGPDEPVGWYALALDGDDLLRDPRSLHCPCRGECPKAGTPLEIRHIDYAYHVGYRDHSSGLAEPLKFGLDAVLPLLADQPPHEDGRTILEGNSPNHGSRGQNVLFSDGHIQWFATRRISPHDRDMFLNDEDRPEPGVGVHDVSLLPPEFRIKTR